MAEDKPLSIVIDADISKLQKAISNVKESIGQISSDLKNTNLGDFGKGLEQSLSQINLRLDELEGSLQKTSTSAKTFTTGTKDARTALTSLSLVAQDAPFGFIAIQNNLPAVISSFGELSKGANGLKGALSQIGSALVGPAGLFLAFSAITGAVTFAIQKYGSLGAAIDAITGNTNQFTEAIQKANKSLAEYDKNAKSNIELRNNSIGAVENEIIKVNALADVLRSSTSSDRQKQGALSELKKANDEYFGKLNAQKIDLDALNESVKLYSESLIKNKVAQNLASEAAGVFTEFLKQNQIAFDIAEKINKAFKDVPSLTKELEDYTKKRDKLIAQGEITAIRFIPISKELAQYFVLNDQLKEVNTNVQSTAKSYGLLKTQADAAFKAASSFLDLGKDGKEGGIKVKDILKLDTQELDEAFNLKDIKSKVNEYGNILLNVNNTEKQRKDALKELIAINPEFANTLSLSKSKLNENKTAIEENIRALNVLIKEKEFDKRASEINTQFRNAELKKQDEAIKLDNDRAESIAKVTTAQDFFIKSLSEFLQKNNSLIAQQKEIQDINKGVIDILTKGLDVENIYEKAIKDLLNFESYQKVAANNIARNFRFLQEPLEGLLTTSLEGASANWKEFADDVIKQIKRITAALLAKSLITGLANILAPGTGSLISSGFEGISDEGIDEWRKLFDPDPTRVNFGGLEGGMQMRGQVVFVQRGSDLVGVLNRTNSTINRVG